MDRILIKYLSLVPFKFHKRFFASSSILNSSASGMELIFLAVSSIFSGSPCTSSALRFWKTSVFIFTWMALCFAWNAAEISLRFVTAMLPFPSVHPVATCMPSTTQDKGGLFPVLTVTDRSRNPFVWRVRFANNPIRTPIVKNGPRCPWNSAALLSISFSSVSMGRPDVMAVCSL